MTSEKNDAIITVYPMGKKGKISLRRKRTVFVVVHECVLATYVDEVFSNRTNAQAYIDSQTYSDDYFILPRKLK